MITITTSSLLYIGESPLIYKNVHDGEINPLFVILLMQNFLLAHLNFSLILKLVTFRSFNPFRNRLFIFMNVYIAGIYLACIVTRGKIDILKCVYVLFVL